MFSRKVNLVEVVAKNRSLREGLKNCINDCSLTAHSYKVNNCINSISYVFNITLGCNSLNLNRKLVECCKTSNDTFE